MLSLTKADTSEKGIDFISPLSFTIIPSEEEMIMVESTEFEPSKRLSSEDVTVAPVRIFNS